MSRSEFSSYRRKRFFLSFIHDPMTMACYLFLVALAVAFVVGWARDNGVIHQ